MSNLWPISLLLWITVADFVSIKSLSTEQTGPQAKIELKSEIPALNMTADEEKISDRQTSWSKMTDRRSSQENNMNYNPYFVTEQEFDLLRSYHLSDIGYQDQRVSISKLVNINEGRTARLKCFTLNVPNVTVSWIRHSDVNILSLNELVYTKDSRISVHVTGDRVEWELSIGSVGAEDCGLYECQVNTNPLSQMMTRLTVTKSFTRIEGDQEVFMAEKSFLNLTCTIQSAETPQGVFWRHNNQLLTSTEDGLVTVSPLSRRSNTTFSISLSVWLVSSDQSGQYQCVPTNTPQAAALVHVLDGHILRAMYSNSHSRLVNILQPLSVYLCCYLLHLAITVLSTTSL